MSQKSMHLSSIYTILFFSCMDRCWCHTTWWQKGSNTLKLHMHTLNIYTCIEQIHKQYRNHCVFMFVSIFFLVPFTGNIYKWYILPIGWLHATYHLLWEPKTSIVCFLQSATNSSTRPFPITKNPCLPGTLAERCSWAALQHASGHGECCRQGTVATHH